MGLSGELALFAEMPGRFGCPHGEPEAAHWLASAPPTRLDHPADEALPQDRGDFAMRVEPDQVGQLVCCWSLTKSRLFGWVDEIMIDVSSLEI